MLKKSLCFIVILVLLALISSTSLASNSEDFILTEKDCLPHLPIPLCYDTLADSGTWPTHSSNNVSPGLWPGSQVWYSASGDVSATIKVASGSYYAYTHIYAYASTRYFTASVNGQTIKNGNEDFRFGYGTGPATLVVCPQPVNLNSGNINIVLKAPSGVVRADFFALIPASYAYDENGNLIDENGEYESIVKVIENMLSNSENSVKKQNFLNFYTQTSAILTSDSVSVTKPSDNSMLIKWKPTINAIGQEITYNIYLNGKKVASVPSNKAPEYLFESIESIYYKIQVDANGNDTQTIILDNGHISELGEKISYSKTKNSLNISGEGKIADFNIYRSPFYNDQDIFLAVVDDGITYIGANTFSGCSNLTYVSIPSSVTEINADAFSNCPALEKIYFSGTYEQWGNIQNSHKLSNITVQCNTSDIAVCGETLISVLTTDGVLTISGSGDMYYNSANTIYDNPARVKKLIIEDGVTSISDNAFQYFDNMTSVEIPASVTYIGRSAFLRAFSIESVYITDLEAWFNIDFSSNTSNPLFYAQSLYLNDEVITDLIVPQTVNIIKPYSFYNYNNLSSVTIANSVTTIGANAFYGSGVTSVIIPDSVTTIGANAFYGSRVTSVIIPDSVTTIGANAFQDCTDLSYVSLSSSVAYIGISAFMICPNLSAIFFGNPDISIALSAFAGCTNLKTVYFSGTEQQWNNLSIAESNGPLHHADKVFNNIAVLTYSANGGSFDIVHEGVSSDNRTIKITEEFPVRRFYDFSGWALAEDATEAVYQPGDEITPVGNLTLYAVWKESPYSTKTTSNIVNGHVVLFVETSKPITASETLHIALYSENKAFLDYIIVPVIKEFNETNIVFKDNADIKYAKIFLWDSVESMTPLSTAEEVTIR